MSRICVKGLPRDVDEARLRAHVGAAFDDITDVKVARTKGGASRLFAFVGFRSDETGARAVRHFDRSFLGAVRLSVEPAKEIGDEGVLQRSWSAHTKRAHPELAAARAAAAAASRGGNVSGGGSGGGGRVDEATHNASAEGSGEGGVVDLGLGRLASAAARGVKNKALLAEYLAAMRSRANAPTWANDDALTRRMTSGKASAPGGGRRSADDLGTSEGVRVEEGEGSSSSSEDEYQDLPSTSADMTGGGAGQGGVAITKPKAPLSDLDFLRSKITTASNFEDEEEEQEDGGEEEIEEGGVMEGEGVESRARPPVGGGKTATKKGSQRLATRVEAEATKGEGGGVEGGEEGGGDDGSHAALSALGETGRLFVRNLPYSANEEDVRIFFSRFGALADVRLPRDSAGRCKGFGYVTYIIPEAAVNALASSDAKIFQGRILHVLPAATLAEAAPQAGDGGGGGGEGEGGGKAGGYKASKEAERKAGALSGSEAASVWNTLFIRADTALAAGAEALGVTRGALMDRDASNLAVRLALAETRVIADTKTFLEENGVCLPSLELSLVAAAAAAADKAAAKAIAAASSGSSSRVQHTHAAANTTSAGGVGASAGGAISMARSDTTILVKNLPPDADIGLLRDMFSRHGSMLRFLVPPSKALAIIEYADPRLARKVFAALAYARFARAPLYLEWAPEAIFVKKATILPPAAAVVGEGGGPPASSSAAAPKKAPSARATDSDDSSDDDDEDDALKSSKTAAANSAAASSVAATGAAVAGRTLFVKNLSFATTEEGLRAVFTSSGGGGGLVIRAVRIPKRQNPKWKATAPTGSNAIVVKGGGGAAAPPPPEAWQSLGYGFVEFSDAAGAARALRDLQGVQLDGHALDLRVSEGMGGGGGGERGAGDAAAGGANSGPSAPAAAAAVIAAAAGGAGGSSAKLMVRNLAFEATKKDLQELLSAFGTLKSVRMPRKFDGTGRGFAFAEFLTRAEAASAMAALASTHLYGRHLVLEWAAATGDGGVGVGAGTAKAGVAAGAGAPAGSKRTRGDAEVGGTASAAAPLEDAAEGTPAAPSAAALKRRAKKARLAAAKAQGGEATEASPRPPPPPPAAAAPAVPLSPQAARDALLRKRKIDATGVASRLGSRVVF